MGENYWKNRREAAVKRSRRLQLRNTQACIQKQQEGNFGRVKNLEIDKHMSVERLRNIVNLAVPTLFRQISGGRVQCESEATLQLHLGRIIATVADLEITSDRETFSVELEKPLRGKNGKRGRIDVWFRLTGDDGKHWRCSVELKFFKRENHREPNNRYDVFKDIHRLENSGDISDIGFMLVATDHRHYSSQEIYSIDTHDFDFREQKSYAAGTVLTYRTGKYGPPITLANDYNFKWADRTSALHYLLVEVSPKASIASPP